MSAFVLFFSKTSPPPRLPLCPSSDPDEVPSTKRHPTHPTCTTCTKRGRPRSHTLHLVVFANAISSRSLHFVCITIRQILHFHGTVQHCLLRCSIPCEGKTSKASQRGKASAVATLFLLVSPWCGGLGIPWCCPSFCNGAHSRCKLDTFQWRPDRQLSSLCFSCVFLVALVPDTSFAYARHHLMAVAKYFYSLQLHNECGHKDMEEPSILMFVAFVSLHFSCILTAAIL